jgi:amidase
MLDLTAGIEPLSRVPLGLPAGGFVAALTTPVSPLRVGVTLAAPGGMRPQAEIGAAVERVAALLARSGHQVKEFTFPDSATVGDPALVIWLTAIAEEIDFYRGRVGRAPERHELDALTWAGIETGNSRSALDYARARRALTAATAGMARVFEEFDVLLLPTAQSYGYAPYTEIFNVTGQPAMSLPLAMSSTGLPIGVQIAAPLGADSRLLSLAAWLERELPWTEPLTLLRHRIL